MIPQILTITAFVLLLNWVWDLFDPSTPPIVATLLQGGTQQVILAPDLKTAEVAVQHVAEGNPIDRVQFQAISKIRYWQLVMEAER